MEGPLGTLMLFWPLWIWPAWAFCTWLVYLAWRMFRPLDNKRIVAQIIFGVVLFGSWFGWSLWEMGLKKVYWDTQVNRMCKVDGGVTVYEQVKLPKDRFDKYGFINFYHPTKGDRALGDDYKYLEDIIYLRAEYPRLSKIHATIYRRSDNMLLAESIIYRREGGDIPGPWPRTSYRCPQSSVGTAIINQVFIKE